MSKQIAVSACAANAPGSPSPKFVCQRGTSLIELLVGVALGLLVVAVAGGALMGARAVSGTVSDASALQQQAAYVFRVIGQQVRQAGGIALNLDPKNQAATGGEPHMLPVAFETWADSPLAGANFDLKTSVHRLTGTDGALTIGYQRYSEPVFSPAVASRPSEYLVRNCLGGPQDIAANKVYKRVESIFELSDGDLRCRGNTVATAQPVIGNVANLRIRYLLQESSSTGSPTIRYVDAATVGTQWQRVAGAEVCLVLHGNERIELPAGATSEYTDCDGSTQVDMSSATSLDMYGAAIGADRAGRMHLVFRHIYQLRSQGLVGSVL